MIISLTGASGAGKGTIFKILHSSNPRLNLIESITTRNRRDADISGEYVYVTELEFKAYKTENRFLWHVGEHGNAYGTLKTSVDAALASKEIFFIFLVPDSVKILLDYSAGKIIPIYILSPVKEKLEQRLKARGESPESVKQRISDCLSWDENAYLAALSGVIPYEFVFNIHSPPEKFVLPKIRRLLRTYLNNNPQTQKI